MDGVFQNMVLVDLRPCLKEKEYRLINKEDPRADIINDRKMKRYPVCGKRCHNDHKHGQDDRDDPLGASVILVHKETVNVPVS